MSKIIITIALLLISTFTFCADDVYGIDSSQYYSGGIIGTVLGFGLGHIAQKRWKNDGKVFTLGEAVSVEVLLGTGRCTSKDASLKSCSKSSKLLYNSGLVSFIGFKVWEIIDLWNVDFNKKSDKNDQALPAAQLSFVPVVSTGAGGFFLNLTY